jgi:hypothetical protein
MLERGFLKDNSKVNSKRKNIIQLIYFAIALPILLIVYLKTDSWMLITSTIIVLLVGYLAMLNIGRDRRRR